MDNRNKPLPRIPSERKVAREEKAEQAQVKQTEAELYMQQLKSAAATVANTAEGIMLLQHIERICGRNLPKAARRYEQGASGALTLMDVNPNATIYNTGKEDVWLALRSLFDKRQRNKIEG